MKIYSTKIFSKSTAKRLMMKMGIPPLDQEIATRGSLSKEPQSLSIKLSK
jgi:hypothetical protein